MKNTIILGSSSSNIDHLFKKKEAKIKDWIKLPKHKKLAVSETYYHRDARHRGDDRKQKVSYAVGKKQKEIYIIDLDELVEFINYHLSDFTEIIKPTEFEELLDMSKYFASVIFHTIPFCRDDKNNAVKAMMVSKKVYEYLSDDLKNDKKLASMATLSHCGNMVKHVSKRFKENRSFAKKAIEKRIDSFRYFPANIRALRGVQNYMEENIKKIKRRATLNLLSAEKQKLAVHTKEGKKIIDMKWLLLKSKLNCTETLNHYLDKNLDENTYSVEKIGFRVGRWDHNAGRHSFDISTKYRIDFDDIFLKKIGNTEYLAAVSEWYKNILRVEYLEWKDKQNDGSFCSVISNAKLKIVALQMINNHLLELVQYASVKEELLERKRMYNKFLSKNSPFHLAAFQTEENIEETRNIAKFILDNSIDEDLLPLERNSTHTCAWNKRIRNAQIDNIPF